MEYLKDFFRYFSEIYWVLLPLAGIALVMWKKRGRDALTADIAEAHGNKTFGASGPRVGVLKGTVLILLLSAILIFAIGFLFDRYLY